MKQGVLKIDDLNPDGVRIIVGWDSFVGVHPLHKY